jgi:tRNA threonylcarbamoyladenosine biosynthesis protein TsaE
VAFEIRLISRSPGDTRKAARAIARRAHPGTFFALSGELGAGKTEFVKGIAEGLEVPDPDLVCSPTFVIASTYAGRLALRHVDAFRLRGPEDLETLGFEEWVLVEGVTALEWAERASALLPDDRLAVLLEHAGEEVRRITCVALGPVCESVLRDAAGELAGLVETVP